MSSCSQSAGGTRCSPQALSKELRNLSMSPMSFNWATTSLSKRLAVLGPWGPSALGAAGAPPVLRSAMASSCCRCLSRSWRSLSRSWRSLSRSWRSLSRSSTSNSFICSWISSRRSSAGLAPALDGLQLAGLLGEAVSSLRWVPALLPLSEPDTLSGGVWLLPLGTRSWPCGWSFSSSWAIS